MLKLAIETGIKNIETESLGLLFDFLKNKEVHYKFLNINQNTSNFVKEKLKELKSKKHIVDDKEVYRFNRLRNASIIKHFSDTQKLEKDIDGTTFVSFNKPFISYISNPNTISKNGDYLFDTMNELSEFLIYLARCRDKLYGSGNYNQYILFDMSHRLLMEKYLKYTGRKLKRNEFNYAMDTIVATYASIDKKLNKEHYIIVAGFNPKTKNHRRFKIKDMKNSFMEVFGKDDE